MPMWRGGVATSLTQDGYCQGRWYAAKLWAWIKELWVLLKGNGVEPGDPALAAKLERALEGDVLFSPFDRGRYSTDASIYQIEPIGVVLPKSEDDLEAALAIAREAGVSVLARGGGTSQAGQTVGRSLVLDCSRYLNRIGEIEPDAGPGPDVGTVWVEPGVVLDHLNKRLKPHGLFYPVDISTGSRATLGGMAGNNACGARSIRYGIMVDNVLEIDALLADGRRGRFGYVPGNLEGDGFADLVQAVRDIASDNVDEIAARYPEVQRRVGGYNLDRVIADEAGGHNMASLLVGSEGTLALFRRLKLKLSRLPAHRVLGVCHFPTFHQAMAATEALVGLGPSAVELVDRSIIELGREIPAYRPLIDRFIRGEPDAVLLVEFSGEDEASCLRDLERLDEAMADLGFPHAVLTAIKPEQQARIWDVRKAGLNIVMSMKGDGKPVSFIEDCAVPLNHLADYTAALTDCFTRHGTTATWYAHASVGTLHVRPILNLKQEKGVSALRSIAEEAMALVKRYKGSHSGEHGDGLVRSEFHERMFGTKLVQAFKEVKQTLDPNGSFNPGKIVDVPKMDDRSLFRFRPDYKALPVAAGLDWSDWGGFLGATEMCNNNGACRKADPGVMCPSYRVTGEEQHVTRGRANSLRLALSGQLGSEALTSDEMVEALDLCVSCKACRHECPTGVDMARMKIEVLHQRRGRHGLDLKAKLIAGLPRYAPYASGMRWLLHARDWVPGLAMLSEWMLGFSAKRTLPRWHGQPYRPAPDEMPFGGDGKDVLLFADTFSTWFEPENARAAERVLKAAGYRVHHPVTAGGRAPCCGRTYLAAGMLEEARAEMRRFIEAVTPAIQTGVPIIGLEPSCLLTLRDEFDALLPGEGLSAENAQLFEEFLAREKAEGRLDLELHPTSWRRARVHGHCHQKAFGAMEAMKTCLDMIPDLEHQAIASSCCGMAGAFGYDSAHYETSMAMAELSLLPAVRATDAETTVIIANGTSCRHQIEGGAGREALHIARLLALALDDQGRG
ncbi:MAG: FAD-binding and (Fe-S)-binding domain-containing protein [Geminicoccaceae bacterium]